jgi:eukaryotic-like serine/threonine-protein kinase
MWIGDAVVKHLQEACDEPDLSNTRYRLSRKLGSGGMGAVYAAMDTALGREVAVKASLDVADPAELSERLLREAGVLARLEHPGIVPVHDAGVLPDGRAYYVMKLVRGVCLDAWVSDVDQRTALRLFQRICETVAFAHAAGVVHRDLKPSNVMVGAFGEALVMDWGVAKTTPTENRMATIAPRGQQASSPLPAVGAGLTVDGAVVGTRGFMAPEQERGEVATMDARVDIYALGALLQFLLAKCGGGDVVIRGGEFLRSRRSLRLLAPTPPRPLAAICRRAMASAPSDRYATALELAEDVGRYLDRLRVRAHEETLFERTARFAERHKVVLSLLTAYVLMRLALIAFTR